MLDCLIPPSPDGRLPGAGSLGVRAQLETALAESPELGPLIAAGLQALETEAQDRHQRAFAALEAPQRSALFADFAQAQPGFVGALVFHTYLGYYRNPRVVEALGLEARAPFPKGYQLEPNDLSLLDPVRERKRLYREP